MPHFGGLYVAIITPFTSDLSLDEQAFRKIVKYQIEGGVQGIVVSGTTGESPNLTDNEFCRLLEICREEADDSCQVIAGTGSNNFEHVTYRSKLAESIGVDGLLVVAPYYNKPTQKALEIHYKAVADSVSSPIMVYNVPGRTSVNIHPETLARMAEHENIVAVKEASNDLNQIQDVLHMLPEGFDVLSGDDALTLPVIAAGGRGVVSVIANEAPAKMAELVKTCLDGDFATARRLNHKLLPLMKANFWESNPAPVKAALNMMGFCENTLRLPLIPLQEHYREALARLLKNLELL